MKSLKQKPFMVVIPLYVVFFLVAILLCGCGGGGGSESSSGTGGGGGGTGGGTGTIGLAWDAVTTNADGSQCNDLGGYKIYYGTTSGHYGTPIDVGNVTTYDLTGLTSGQRYYIIATAYNVSDSESGYSNEVSGAAE